MTSRRRSIQALLKRSRADLKRIESEYAQSLAAKAVDENLKIDIKNLCENLRSVLDYLAHDIRDQFCEPLKDRERIYFPILAGQKEFKRNMSRWFPSLSESALSVWEYLGSIQPYQSTDTQWIAQFNQVNNKNKHGDLVEQTRTEMERIHATHRAGGSVDWDPRSVTFGSGVSILGSPVDPSTQMPRSTPDVTVERILWVDFRFAGQNVSVIGLLRKSVAQIEQIAQRIEVLIQESQH